MSLTLPDVPNADAGRGEQASLSARAGMAAAAPPRGYRLATAVFIVCWALLSAPWLSGRVTIPYDAKAHFQAQIQFMAKALHSGQSPFWSPFTFAGSPQIADPQSLIFSPAALLALFDADPSFWIMDTYVLAMLGLAGLATLAYFRDRGWHPAGGVVAAVALAFGASAAWRVQHIGQIKSFALVWVSLWLLSRALRRQSVAYGMAAGFAAGIMLMEPDQVALLGAYMLGGFALDYWLSQPRPLAAIKASIAPIGAATIVGAFLVVIPLVLTMLFVSDSNRPQIPFAEAVRGSLHPASLLTFLVGDLYGAHDPHVNYWGPFSEYWDPTELTLSQNMSQVYLGALPFLLLLTHGLTRGYALAREIRFFTCAGLVFIVYAIGRHTPLFALMFDHVPGVALFRRPADATFLIGGVMAILGGYLVHRLASAKPALRLPMSQRLAAVVLPVAGILLAILIALVMRHMADAWKPILYAVGWLAASALVIANLRRIAIAAPRAAILLPAVLLAADLAANNGPNESTALPPSSYAVLDPNCGNETVRLLKSLLKQRPDSARRDRVELTGLGFEWPNAAMVHGFDHVLGYNPLRLELVNESVGARDTIAGPDQRKFTPLFPSYASRLADLLGLRFIATSIPVEEIDHKLKPGDLRLIARTPDAYVYENPRAFPRALFVRSAARADFAAIIKSGRWPEFEPTETVLVDRDADIPEAALRRSSPMPLHATIKLKRYENTRIELDVDSPEPGYAVLNDVWHPWWEADVDGRQTPILRANVLFRAVSVPAGRHTVVFEFKPIAGAFEELSQRMRPNVHAALPVRPDDADVMTAVP